MNDSLVLDLDLDIVKSEFNDIEPDDVLDWNEDKISWRYDLAD